MTYAQEGTIPFVETGKLNESCYTITDSNLSYTYIPMPKYVGGYQLGGMCGLKINFEQKPIWLHRKMMKWCLGWEWIDNT